ncbi:NINE protein [Metasolibacillus meyeri]|uniref:NINE protein n=1 Tax=Metasolibacillus meyeri TaxID=1071052 RepID=UPI000D3126AF|nr:NINE protein [Metasolibacillus meyeri]
MSNLKCSQCGAPVETNRTHCKYCGGKYNFPSQAAAQANMDESTFQQRTSQTSGHREYASGIDPSWPIKSQGLAAFLAFFFGGLGLHKFYLGRPWMGLFYLLFCWSGAPTAIGMIEGVVYLLQNKHTFQVKNKVRIFT